MPWDDEREAAADAIIAAAKLNRAPTHDERWSDHAPLVVTYDV